MELEDAIKFLDQQKTGEMSAREALAEIEKLLFVIEQVDAETEEEREMKDYLIKSISIRLPILRAGIEMKEIHDSWDNDNDSTNSHS